jgi:hypothetical protein
VQASTAKVNGEATATGKPFRVDNVPAPQDVYARSKWQAECALRDVAAGTPMSSVVLRLPLVYGPGVRGNFRTLWDAVARRQWLPFAAIDNRRSLIGLDNLFSLRDCHVCAPLFFGDCFPHLKHRRFGAGVRRQSDDCGAVHPSFGTPGSVYACPPVTRFV